MVNRESSPNIKQETGWDDLANGPAEIVDEPVKDAEYYRNNRNEISNLASEMVKLRGGVEAAIHGPKVDENGIPTRWGDMCQYLRKHPDAIDLIVAERDRLTNGELEEPEEETEAEESVAEAAPKSNEEALDEALAEDGDEEAEDETELPLPDNIVEMSKAEKTEESGDKDVMEIPGFATMTVDQKVAAIDSRVDTIQNFHKQSSAWDKLKDALSKASAGVQAKVNYLRAEQTLNRDKASLKEKQDELRSISPVMPWSKNAERAKTLKTVIESTKRSISYNESQLALKKTMMPDKLSDTEESLVSKFRALDAKMDRVNEDLHIREHKRDIKMRENWIRDQKKFMEDDMANGGKDAASFAKRHEQIAKWEEEIAGYKKRIEDYQKAHPDFVLNPDEKKPAAEEKKAA